MSLGSFGKEFSVRALALAIFLAPMAVISIPAPSAEAQFYFRIPFGIRFHGGGRHNHYSHSARAGRHHSHHARAPSRSHRSTASSGGGGGGGKSGRGLMGTTD